MKKILCYELYIYEGFHEFPLIGTFSSLRNLKKFCKKRKLVKNVDYVYRIRFF